MTGIGGFFATLKIQYDQASSDKSKKEIKELGEQAKKTGAEFDKFVGNAIKGIIALGTAAAGSAYAVSNIQGKMALTAKNAGMGYSELNKWSSALKLIGMDASNVTSKMTSVNEAISDYKIGLNTEAYESLAKDLSLMGIDVNKFAKMDATERILSVAGKAEAARGTDKERAMLDLADKLLGIGDILMTGTMAGTKYPTTASLLAAGAGATWGSNASDVTKNSQSFNAFKNQMDQVWKTAGETMANTFRPIIDDLTKFIKDHKAEIQAFFKDLGSLLSDTITLLKPTLETIVGSVGEQVHKNAETARMIKWQKENPQDYLRLEEAIGKSGKIGLEFMGKPIPGNVSHDEALLYAKQIEEAGQKYIATASAQGRMQYAGSPTANSVTIGSINLTGTDFNQFINYMQANPSASKESVAVAALAAANTIAGTK
jgi:hypothetical protein